MGSTFEKYLEYMADKLYDTSNDDDFKSVRDYILRRIVMANDLLTSTFEVEYLDFGSRALQIPNSDSDYDVMVVLKFPYFKDIFVRTDQHRPGMYHLDLKDVPYNSFTADNLLDNRCYLSRDKVQTLMQCILMNAHDRTVRSYRLRYRRGQNCHTIIAESSKRTFCIDFVPAIKIHFDGFDCHAVPKEAPGPKRSNGCTFMRIHPANEMFYFKTGGKKIRDAVMLLKAMCEAKNLPKIRKYHLVSLANALIEEDNFEDSSLEYVFLDLLCDLADAFDNGHLPYFLSDLNLLTNFNPNQLLSYSDALDSAYSTLKTYPGQDNLSFARCSWHFFDD
ncbi:uncharacterized protein LOC120444711 [Drosophila santomea]|uniref:uncharacterized protein LOC120444711 n=1 Tax=Drosophila santomea TaxID=129105 RepID=UPI001954B15E|nr:uncharacterized protein LOC120444711 [Drosophila santomea]XP_039480523.1 uncharacterized protein LOC120444711 [Drosophila santomea]